MLSSNLLLACLLVIAFLALFASIIIWMVRREKARKEAERQMLSTFGFAPVASPDPEIYARLENLHRRRASQKFELRSLYERRAANGKFLVFDLVETSGESNTFLGANAIAVLDPGLCLPRAAIVGRLTMEGQTAGWMVKTAEKVLDWALRQNSLQRLSLEDAPDLDAKLIIMAEDEAAFRAAFPVDRLRRLTWLGGTTRPSTIDCTGDMFILQRQVSPDKPNPEQDFSDLLREAQQAWSALA